MELFTKEQAIKMALRPMIVSESIIDRCVVRLNAMPQQRFIRVFRKSTGLMLCSFAPNKFYIRYEN